MLDRKNLFELAKVTAKANKNAPVAYSFGEDKFTYAQLNDTLRTELNALAATPALYRENMNTIFALIETIVDEVLPVRTIDAYGQFAEIKQFAQGEKPVFVQKVTDASRRRAKQFITKVGLAGVYEVFKLDGRAFEIQMAAYGGAAQISIEEFLDGRLDLAEMIDIVMEGITDRIYEEILKALQGVVANVQAPYTVSSTGAFDEAAFDALLAKADSYGGKATIYAPYELAAQMIPDVAWANDALKAEKWANGYLRNYKGHNVIILPQVYTEEDFGGALIDTDTAIILPTGMMKPVKIAFEGQTLVDEWKNRDWSKEVQVYKKVGVGIVATDKVFTYTIDAE